MLNSLYWKLLNAAANHNTNDLMAAQALLQVRDHDVDGGMQGAGNPKRGSVVQQKKLKVK